LQIKVKDGNGNYTSFSYEKNISVKAADNFTQILEEQFAVKFDENWKAGYITVEGKILQNGKLITDGTEQILLKNRKSYNSDLKGKSISVINWNDAEKALTESGTSFSKYDKTSKSAQIILAGEIVDSNIFSDILKQVKSGGKLILKFNAEWANLLYENKILKEKVTIWGGKQTSFWNANGWGYLDKIIGNQAIPSVSCIGTNSWEVPSDPIGFEPFVSNFKQKSYGAFFYRPDKLLTLCGEIYYGKGSIVLAPSYPVGLENAFSDLIFFTILKIHLDL